MYIMWFDNWKNTKMKTLADIQGNTNYTYSLVKLLDGVGIQDIQIAFSNQWGEPLITAYGITLADGRYLSLQGEHDIVYIEEYGLVSPEQLELFLEEDAAKND